MLNGTRNATTLIELMMITVIIGILALVLVPHVERARHDVLMVEVRAELDSMAWMARRYGAARSGYTGFDTAYQANDDIALTYTWLEEDGLLASAQHAQVPDRVCHVVVGRVPAELVPEGVVPGRTVCVEL